MFCLRSVSVTTRAASIAAFAACSMAGSALADEVADFYKGKQITVVVGYGPGGGYDVYTRMLLRHMPRHIPGNPTMIVQNMPGAGSLRAANYVANAAPKDGTCLGVIGAPAALEPLFGGKDAKFETLKLHWLGNLLRDTQACGTWRNSGITSLQQIIDSKTPIVFGASGPGSYGYQHAMVLKHMVGANLRVITGFKGIKDVGLALERGELPAACALSVSTANSVFKSNVDNGELKFFVQFGKRDLTQFRGAPSFYRMLKTDDERQIADLFFGQSEIARPLIAPPGTPAHIVAALKKAMAATAADKTFLAEAAKANLDIEFVTGEETAQEFAAFYNSKPELVQKAREIMGRK